MNLKNRITGVGTRRWTGQKGNNPSLPAPVETTGFPSVFLSAYHSPKHIASMREHPPRRVTNQELKVMEGRKGDLWT